MHPTFRCKRCPDYPTRNIVCIWVEQNHRKIKQLAKTPYRKNSKQPRAVRGATCLCGTHSYFYALICYNKHMLSC